MAETTDDIELASPQISGINAEEDSSSVDKHGSALPPVDRGFRAWSFLAIGFFVEAVVWGFPFAFGTFLDAYLADERLTSQKHAQVLLPLIGTLSTGVLYCSGPFIYPVISRYPRCRPAFMYFGTLLCFGSLFSASYATTIHQMITLQGVFFGIGASCLYAPYMSYLPEWFVERRGSATGVIFAGTATGGVVLPLVLPAMLASLGAAKTLRILAVVNLCLIAPMIPLVKARLPASRVRAGPSARAAGGGVAWMKDGSFCLYMLANVLQGLAYFIPFIWLPTFASYLNLNKFLSSLALALLNGSTLIGLIVFGSLSDFVSPWTLALVNLISTTLIAVVQWGVLSHNAAGLFAFAIMYGAMAGGWSSLFSSFIKPVAKDDPKLSSSLFGYMLFLRGIGNVVSTPISAFLSQTQSTKRVARGGLGFSVDHGRFGNMIAYVGVCFAVATVCVALGWRVQKLARRD